MVIRRSLLLLLLLLYWKCVTVECGSRVCCGCRDGSSFHVDGGPFVGGLPEGCGDDAAVGLGGEEEEEREKRDYQSHSLTGSAFKQITHARVSHQAYELRVWGPSRMRVNYESTIPVCRCAECESFKEKGSYFWPNPEFCKMTENQTGFGLKFQLKKPTISTSTLRGLFKECPCDSESQAGGRTGQCHVMDEMCVASQGWVKMKEIEQEREQSGNKKKQNYSSLYELNSNYCRAIMRDRDERLFPNPLNSR